MVDVFIYDLITNHLSNYQYERSIDEKIFFKDLITSIKNICFTLIAFHGELISRSFSILKIKKFVTSKLIPEGKGYFSACAL